MTNEAYKLIFDYLLKLSNGKLFLNSKQLEQATGILVKQQSLLRLNNEMPIAFKTIGRIVYYSIDAVIKYLLDGEITNKKSLSIIVQPEQSKPLSIIKRKKSNDKDLSHLFNLRCLSTNIGVEIAELTELKDMINKCIETTDQYYQLQYALLYNEVKEKVVKQ